MFDRLTTTARALVATAQDEAAALGAPTIEAEHVLLALAAQAGDARAALTAAELDHARLVALLVDERRRSLAVAGIEATPSPTSGPARKRGSLRLATSAKAVLERAVKESAVARSRAIGEAQLLVAVLQAETGTVPRMLALAGVDRAAMVEELRRRPAA